MEKTFGEQPPYTAAASLPEALLVDLDGTLVETEPLWQTVQQNLVEDLGGTWSDTFNQKLIGTSLLEAATLIKERAKTNVPAAAIARSITSGMVELAKRGEVQPLPGARELFLLAGGLGIPVGVVTASHGGLAEASLAALPEANPEILVTGDMVLHGKPHPESYLHAANMLGVNIRRCVVFEDSTPGLQAGLAAGAVTVAIPNHARLGPLLGAHLLESLTLLDENFLKKMVEAGPA